MSRRDAPETLRQAARWDAWNRELVDLGLCYRCAAQGAWGRQIGFRRVHQPCATCAPIVATVTTLAGWATETPRSAI